MSVIYLAVWDDKEIYGAFELGNFGYFQRTPLKEFTRFATKEFALKETGRTVLPFCPDKKENYKMCVLQKEESSSKEEESKIKKHYVLVAVNDYPNSTAFRVLEQLAMIDDWEEAKEKN